MPIRFLGRLLDLQTFALLTRKAHVIGDFFNEPRHVLSEPLGNHLTWHFLVLDSVMQQRGNHEVRVPPLSGIGNECRNLQEVID